MRQQYSVEMLALRDITFPNCHDVGLNVDFTFLASVWQRSDRVLQSATFIVLNPTLTVFVSIDVSTCILSLSKTNQVEMVRCMVRNNFMGSARAQVFIDENFMSHFDRLCQYQIICILWRRSPILV